MSDTGAMLAVPDDISSRFVVLTAPSSFVTRTIDDGEHVLDSCLCLPVLDVPYRPHKTVTHVFKVLQNHHSSSEIAATCLLIMECAYMLSYDVANHSFNVSTSASGKEPFGAPNSRSSTSE